MTDSSSRRERPTTSDVAVGAAADPDESAEDHAVAEALARRFAALHGRRPTGVFAAPGRVNLMGEHTDYNDGWCLPLALRHSTYVAVAPRSDSAVRITSLQQATSYAAELGDLTADSITGWPAYAAGVLWSLGEAGVVLPGLDLLIDSHVPVGAGLSSSAALECAVALAACSAAGVVVDGGQRRRLVELCVRAEREVAGAPTGGMDQTVSLLGAASTALLIDCRDATTTHVPWHPERAGLELLVVDTGVAHALADGQYAVRRSECEQAARSLGLPSLRELDVLVDGDDLESVLGRLPSGPLRRRVRHVYRENARVHAVVAAAAAGDFERVGELFDASHASLRDDYEVSCPELDVAVESARAAGALGARMTGGGFGGSAIVLAPRGARADIERRVVADFAARGWASPRFLEAIPSAGAREVTAVGGADA